jgi:type IV pilus modification protein PilV
MINIKNHSSTAPINQLKQVGETLVEVLIAIALVAFSLLGIARLALSATQAQKDGEFKVKINALINDTSSRISVNRSEADGILTTANKGYTFDVTWNNQAGDISSPATDCGSATCTAAQRSAFDIYEVRNAARNQFPQGSITLTGNSSSGMVLSLYWVDKNFLNTSVKPTVFGTSPTCSASTSVLSRNSCCPSATAIPASAGIRCTNYYFTP